MKAYGIIINEDFIKEYALASHAINVAGKNGEFHSSIRSSKSKKAIRRYWKKRERRAAKKEILVLV